ncbi:hypothetical protein A2U01_0050044, partial [Trifolium medium]|nr:hypothetical protein [Trifolium medium]
LGSIPSGANFSGLVHTRVVNPAGSRRSGAVARRYGMAESGTVSLCGRYSRVSGYLPLSAIPLSQ